MHQNTSRKQQNVLPLLLISLVAVANAVALSVQPNAKNPLEHWSLTGDARLVGADSAGLLHIGSGVAVSPTATFTTGTIELEV